MKADNTQFILESIMRDMSEGVMSIQLDGLITYVNPAAAAILGKSIESLVGQRFMRCFFEYEENDAFNQTVLDAVYDTSVSHRSIVPYFTGTKTLQLHVTTSYLKKAEEKIGVVVVLSDISELSELRDAVKAMERIKSLNGQLELRNKLLNETFGRFLSDEIVRQLLETPDGLALGGKKRPVTVMMSDLRGFTAMSERMEAQALISMLNHYLGEMTEIIQRRNGTIIEFIGDGIMAIFGAPLDSDKHASDAVAAGIEMQLAMERINQWNREQGFPRLEMGIGINTGDVIVGNIGSEKRTKYGVVGSNVNLTGRIESYTVGGQVLISPATRALISEELEINSEQSVFPKGVKEALVISSVRGIKGAYGLSLSREEESLTTLKKPIEVEFCVIHGKHGDAKRLQGKITAFSETSAVLRTEAELQCFDNIRIDAGGELFCKLVSMAPDGWLIRFTAVPPGFGEWISKRINT